MPPTHRRDRLADEAALAWLDGSAQEGPLDEPTSDVVAKPANEGALSAPAASNEALLADSLRSREIVNAGDAVVDLATLTRATPPTSLHERILRSAARTLPSRGVAPRAGSPRVGPANEAVGKLHQSAPGDAARTEAIDALRALGGPGEEVVDAALRRVILQMAPFLTLEVVFVSVVRGELTVHRVHKGFPPELGDLDVVPRELSFCTHTVSAREVFCVDDTEREAFFRQSDLVRKLGARAYLGVPIVLEAKDGEARAPRATQPVVLGSLCGISRAPQTIRPADVAVVRAFADVAQALVNHRPELAFGAGAEGVAPLAQLLYRAPVMRALVAAVRAQIAAGSSMAAPTEVISLPRAAAEHLARERDDLPVGEADDGAALLLLASRHPAAGAVRARALELAPTAAVERLA